MKLKFTRGNAKLDKLESYLGGQVWTFSLLSGHTCPYAKDCHSKAIRENGKTKIVDGPHTQFRCFSASQEVLYPAVYDSRNYNMGILELAAQSVEKASQAILDSIPSKAAAIRIHVGGDFKTQTYFDAWNLAAKERPELLFYAYTKSLPFWVRRRSERAIAKNLILTASYGGYRDDLISKKRLRYCKVVFSEAEANKLGLPIDSDDSHAADPDLKFQSFALLIHGVQPAGSEAGKAVKKLKGKGSYRRAA